MTAIGRITAPVGRIKMTVGTRRLAHMAKSNFGANVLNVDMLLKALGLPLR